MWIINLLLFSLKQLRRHWIRTLLTVAGTACGMFLFMTVETFQNGLKEATETQAGDDTLVVYRDKRFCPFTSRLPENYGRKIAKIEGVKSVTPVKVIVNNCGTSLDTVTFRGIPPKQAADFLADTSINQAEIDLWSRANDSAILGKELASRRGLKPGDQFDAAGITVRVAGIMESENPQDQNSAYVHLDFIQKASNHGLGIVTQFNVKVTDHRKLSEVADAIDNTFRSDQEPTHTRPEKAFIAQTAKDMVELIAFTRWLGLAAVVAVLCLVTNTVILAVRGRIKENAVMQAMGFQSEHMAWMTLAEGIILGVIGGLTGTGLAIWALQAGHFAISAEGLSIVFSVNKDLFIKALVVALGIGLFSGIYPAVLSVKGRLSDKLRSS
ncbi:MAG: ABC transporter permease [Lentisphaeraceae bacterium]|nr:ABC transporter permease [Lentisphaeraceae bacterium]